MSTRRAANTRCITHRPLIACETAPAPQAKELKEDPRDCYNNQQNDLGSHGYLTSGEDINTPTTRLLAEWVTASLPSLQVTAAAHMPGADSSSSSNH